VEPFEIDINGSQILALPTTCGELIYQQIQNIGFVNLLPIEDNIIQMEEPSYKIKVPLPNGKAINGIFQELILTPIDSEIIRKFDAYTWDEENQQKEIRESEIVNILNSL
jgi:Tfp pilus assembly protein PilO